jgi:hypothetical protein
MALNILQNFREDNLIEKRLQTDDAFEKWLVSLGLLHGNKICKCEKNGVICNQVMKDRNNNQGTRIWRCSRRTRHSNNQNRMEGFKTRTFFENSNLSFKDVFRLSYFWAMNQASIEYISYETGITCANIALWFKKFRRICRRHLRGNRMRIGGPGITVECDETFMSRKHGGRGRQVRQRSQWIFGITERGSGHSVFKAVRRRNIPTLIPLILRYIRPGSTVITDEFRTYLILRRMGQYRHFNVQHNVNFVDPNNPRIHTQSVESKWGKWKKWVRIRNGVHDRSLKFQLYEFMWRERHGRRDQVFFNFWSHVAAQFPCDP